MQRHDVANSPGSGDDLPQVVSQGHVRVLLGTRAAVSVNATNEGLARTDTSLTLPQVWKTRALRTGVAWGHGRLIGSAGE